MKSVEGIHRRYNDGTVVQPITAIFNQLNVLGGQIPILLGGELLLINQSKKSTAAKAKDSSPVMENCVSVIVPTYNRERFLKQALDSVLAQTHPGFELIVVDDGSEDGTPELLASYGEAVQVIRQANQGVSAARNAGIRSASGQLVALLDSDDYWLPKKLEQQVALFSAHPEAQICQTEEVWMRNGVRVNPKKRHRKYHGMIFEKTLPLCLVSPSAVMFRKSLLDEVGLFDETLPACEDYDLWLRITWKYPVHLIDTPLIVKRGGHADQLSRMPELDKYRIQSLANIMNQGYLSPAQHEAALAMLIQKCEIFSNGCRKRGRLEQAQYYESLPSHFGGKTSS